VVEIQNSVMVAGVRGLIELEFVTSNSMLRQIESSKALRVALFVTEVS